VSAIAERFPTFARHWSVLADSWRLQNEADRQRRDRSDHEFLPAALEIIEKPPSVGLRVLLLTLCALFALALAWSFVGRVDVIAVAPGKTIPAGNTKVVQPVGIGSVRAIYVSDGDFVRKGQLLVDLDPTVATADTEQSAQALLSADLARARNDALLAYLSGKPAPFVAPAGTPSDVADTQRRLVRSAIASYEAQRASLLQQRAQRQAELDAANAEIAKLSETLPFLDQQLAARRDLAAKGYFSKLKVLEYEQARVEHLRDADVQRASAARASAAIGDIDAQLANLRDTFEKTAASDLSDATDKAGTASEEVKKTQKQRELMQLRAPVDGVVQQLAVTTVGGVVQPAQPLMVIVPCSGSRPDSCRSPMEAEASVLNRDAGFVHSGQRVVVKVEAFNFTDYGFIEGRVRSLSRDAVDPPNKSDASGEGEPMRSEASGTVYVAKIDLNCGLPRNTSLCARLSPGMAVQAEIRTGSRRIIDYLLSPLSKTVREAGRER
jgi:hemolysin D